ncbi:MAG TPA: hypothetical protein VIT67_15135, partial [Povalibacter sp.]
KIREGIRGVLCCLAFLLTQPMRLTTLRELRLLEPPQPGRGAFLSAASGLVRVGSRFCVVADDELQLGMFPVTGDTPGTLIRMIDGELPDDTEARKKVKQDFEALTMLPPTSHYPRGALLALGSGSKKRRRGGVWLPLNEQDVADATTARQIDATRLFETIGKEIDDVNIEGALVQDGKLVLLHRGNKRHAVNAILSMDLRAVLRSIEHDSEIGHVPLVSVRHYDLGSTEGVPLGFTDGTALPDGRIVFSTVAEDSSDSYSDGACVAAAIGVLDSQGRLQSLNLLDDCPKVEGIHAQPEDCSFRLWCVTDADDPGVPAALLTVRFPD